MWQLLAIISAGVNVLILMFFVIQLRSMRKTNSFIAESLENLQDNGTQKQSEVNVVETISNSLEGVLFALDLDLHISYISSRITFLTGYSLQYCINSPIMCLLTNKTYIDLKRIIDYTTEDKVLETSGNLLSADNKEISTIIKLKKSICPATGKLFWAGIFTPPKLHTDEVNSLKNVYRQVLENAGTSVLIADMEGIIVQVNNAFCSKLEYTSDELIGRKIADFNGKFLPNYQELWANIRHGVKWRSECQTESKSGHKYWDIITITPLKDSSGEYSLFCAYIEDITSIMDKYQGLENTSKMLNNQVEIRNKIFSLISHDLRNSVGNLRNITTLQIAELDNKNCDISTIKKYSDIMSECSSSTYSMLENLLVWSKNMFIRKSLSSEVFDAEDTIKSGLELIQAQASQKNITLECCAENFTEVFGDLQAFNAVLRNLVVNAIKFTEIGGKITVSISASDDENFAEISVADSGVGMTETQKQNIFGQNPQFTTTMGTMNEKGTGFGLMLCKDFVKNMGGKIWVEDNKPKGTVFKFTIPFA